MVWSKDEQSELLYCVSKYPELTSAELARQLVEEGTFKGRTANAIRFKIEDLKRFPVPVDSITEQGTADEKAITVNSETVRTLEELLSAAKVDLDEWEVKDWTANKWDNAQKQADGTVKVITLWQVKAYLKRRVDEIRLRETRDAILKEIAEHAPKYKPVVRKAEGEYLLEVSPFDLHIGKLAWGAETGEDYDSKIATDRLEAAIEQILSLTKNFPIKEVLFVIGQDLLHTDGLLQTTANGTRQDFDSRHQRMFGLAWRAMQAAIDRLRLIAPVAVKVIPGNHDQDSAFKIGEVLWALYSKDEQVTIDNAPTLRKYHRFGNTLLGFTHGCYEKHDKLPLIMATEAKEEWSETNFHEWHVGHYHIKRETRYTAGDTHNGVGVTILPSLSGTDAWHSQMGYVKGPKAAQAFVFCPKYGEVARITANYLD